MANLNFKVIACIKHSFHFYKDISTFAILMRHPGLSALYSLRTN